MPHDHADITHRPSLSATAARRLLGAAGAMTAAEDRRIAEAAIEQAVGGA